MSTMFRNDGADRRSGRHRVLRAPRIAIALVATLSLAVTACEDPDPGPKTYFSDLPAPEGEGLMRYRDEVFPEVVKTSDISWSSAPDLAGNPVQLRLDVYQPAGDTASHRPVVIVAHSGGFYSGSKANATTVDLANRFARKGYVAVAINYRKLAAVNCGSLGGLISDASGCRTATLAATSDGQAAVRWVRANAATFGMDSGRVAMMGDSAGALVSLLTGILADVAENPDDPESQEVMAGVPRNESHPGHSSAIQAWSSISGGLPPTETDGLGARLKDVATPPAPGYLFASPTDNQTPYDWSVDVRDELVIARSWVAFEEVTGGHVPYNRHKELFNSQSAHLFYYFMALGDAPQ